MKHCFINILKYILCLLINTTFLKLIRCLQFNNTYFIQYLLNKINRISWITKLTRKSKLKYQLNVSKSGMFQYYLRTQLWYFTCISQVWNNSIHCNQREHFILLKWSTLAWRIWERLKIKHLKCAYILVILTV